MTNLLQMPQTEQALFDEWWKLQFHKVNRLLCRAKWLEIISPEGHATQIKDKSNNTYMDAHLQASPQEILEAQKRQNKRFFTQYGTSGPKYEEAKKFLRRPQQWLNQGGWMDE